ncbi:hypothetical protein SAMN04488505_105375 [Chitinophaga rupis]|uniref:Uncharacterized protein n=1 Tax=Chitinophaga rupis TaxID=573321 RepID=A0A1H8AAW7_9BACT|nr:hypothetical protein SAMN04488505_105375 [Chitinophaga rupis]
MENEKPPLFRAWWIWYLLVTVWLAVLILLFFLFTKTFS